MELWTGAFSCWKCYWPDLKSAGLFPRNLLLNSLKTSSNPNPNPLANQLWCTDFPTPPTPLITPHRFPDFLESLMLLKNWCSIHARRSKSCLKHSIRFCGIFSIFKTESYCISFFQVSSHPDCIFEIYQLWQSGFCRMYSNSYCSCLFEHEIIKIGLSSHKMYSNNILNFQESTTILNACTKKYGNVLMHHVSSLQLVLPSTSCKMSDNSWTTSLSSRRENSFRFLSLKLLGWSNGKRE